MYIKLSDCVEIQGLDEQCDLLFNRKTETFKVRGQDTQKVYYYKLWMLPSDLSKNQKIDILNYCLGDNNYSLADEEVTYKDMFLHGQFVECLTNKEL